MSSTNLVLSSVLSSSIAEPADATSHEAAYERLLPRLQGLDEGALVPVTIDVPGSVTQVLGLLPGLMGLRTQAAALPDYDATCFDQLGECTRALSHAHTGTLSPAPAPHSDVPALNVACTAAREKLMIDASYLVRYKLIDGEQIAAIKGLSGYRNVAYDLLALVKALVTRWATIEGKTLVTRDELARARQMAEQLLDAIGEREHLASAIAEASQLRQRAFTLFVQTYDEVRRAVTFLRWREDDADTLCPSLYAGRRSKRSDRGETTPVAPVVAGAPGGPVSPVPPVSPRVEELPGGNPFIS